MSEIQQAKALALDYFKALENCKPEEVQAVLDQYMVDGCTWEGSYPFMFQTGTKAIADTFWTPLKASLTSMQRRMDIFMAGVAQDGKMWVASMGQFMGNYNKELLNIRVTGKMQHLWYSEFLCVEEGKITDAAIFVDLLGFMNEAGDNPLPMETGHFFVYPGPQDHNGLLFDEQDSAKVAVSMDIFDRMGADLLELSASGSFDTVPVETMRNYWADNMIWYGPCGVGASFTIETYLQQHSGPFRRHLDKKDMRTQEACFLKEDAAGFARRGDEIKSQFAEGDFVAAYADMMVSPIGGWLGMTAGLKDVPLHADLDFYYVKDGKISENWCYFDIPYFLKCQGYDVFERTASIVNPK